MTLMTLVTLRGSLYHHITPSLGIFCNLKATFNLHSTWIQPWTNDPYPETPAPSVCLSPLKMQPLATPPGGLLGMSKLTHSQILGPLASCSVTDCRGNLAMLASCPQGSPREPK